MKEIADILLQDGDAGLTSEESIAIQLIVEINSVTVIVDLKHTHTYIRAAANILDDCRCFCQKDFGYLGYKHIYLSQGFGVSLFS